MRFSPETDPHYWDHKVFTTNELYDAMEERDRLKRELAEVSESRILSRSHRDKMKLEMRKLKAKRKEKKISLRAMAGRMRISKSALGRLENGEREITEDLIENYRLSLKSV